MNDEQRQKIKREMIKKGWVTNRLLQECLSAMGEQAEIVPYEEGLELLGALNRTLRRLFRPEKQYCPAGWEELDSVQEIAPQWMGSRVYIVWDGGNLPVVRGSLASVVRNAEDVTAVSFDTWVVSEDLSQLVEMRGDGEIRRYVTE